MQCYSNATAKAHPTPRDKKKNVDADLFETYKEYLLGDYCYDLSKERRLAKKLPAGVPISATYIDEEGRADMSWRNVPDCEKPPRALSGPGHGKGKQTHAANTVQDAYGAGPIMDEVNPRDPMFDPAEYIPNTGSIVFEEGLTGRGRYDTLNQIFRCIVRCPRCRGPIYVTGGCGSPSITTPSITAGGASKIWG